MAKRPSMHETAAEHHALEIRRRDLLLAAGTSLTVGLDATIAPSAKAAVGSANAKIDAHTHFAPLKFLEFAEAAEGHPFPLSRLYKSKPGLTEVQPRIDLLDRNGIDIHSSFRFQGSRAFRS